MVDETAFDPLISPASKSDSDQDDAGPQMDEGLGVVFAFADLPEKARIQSRTSRRGSATGETYVARIAGVNIPTNKRVLIALQYIHGIGQKSAAEIMRR